MRNSLTLSILALVLAGPAAASSLDLNFNDYSAQAEFASEIAADQYGRSQWRGRLLYNDKRDTVLGSVGVDFLGSPGNIPGLELGIGAKVNGGKTASGRARQDLLTLAIGGQGIFAPPFWGGFGIAGSLFYSPQIFSLLDAERLLEWDVRLNYAVSPRIGVYAGYQRTRADFDRPTPAKRTIDEGLRLGFRAYF